MTSDYTFKTLPINAPADDPTWRTWVDALRLGFHDPRTSDKHVEVVRSVVQADQWNRRVAYPNRPTLTPEAIAATFATTTKHINTGGGHNLDCSYISEVTVRHSERRRGLLRTLMLESLQESKAAGIPLAALTASEGSIYGRFGFEVAVWRCKAEIDARKWQLRQPATGSVEIIDRHDVEPYALKIWEHQLHHERGNFERSYFNKLNLRSLDWSSFEDNPKGRALVHLDADGTVDGYALYSFDSWDPEPSASVNEVYGTSMASEIALWDALVNLDLVTKLSTHSLSLNHPVLQAITNPRAVDISLIRDGYWLRILDVVAALEGRGFSHDGALHLHVTDPLDLAAGYFALTVAQGQAQVAPISREAFGQNQPAITLGVDALAALYFGGTTVHELAGAGRITGELGAISTAAGLFAVNEVPRMSADF